MVLLGCRPKDRLTEQHDIFFGIAPSLKSLVPQLKTFWPKGKSNLHIDAWRNVNIVDGYTISLSNHPAKVTPHLNLYFINLGGYQKGNFDELHYKMLIVASNVTEAAEKAKSVDFYKTFGFTGAESHIDNKYEVDDIINIKDLLTPGEYYLNIEKLNNPDTRADEIRLGYFELNALQDNW
ncbi:MAG: DUF1543 domain-containing protein [Bacteroidota bacterium]